jgi:serine O-acetyltransferase
LEFSFRRLRLIISSLRLMPHVVILLGAKNSYIKADLTRWAEAWYLEKPGTLGDFVLLLLTFMTFAKEFRNIFYMRYGIKAKIFSWMCPQLSTLDISITNIGPGLYIQHGGGTFISAESIGDNCWINQQVTIGYSNRTDQPTIGNNVRIFAGAKIIGKVTIGDNATVGLNTVVINDVAPNTTVLGVPAKVIWSSKPNSQSGDS